MQTLSNIISCYDAVAENYAAQFLDELSGKHLDRLLLDAFAEANRDRGTLADFGCGPGQTAKFLYDLGVRDLIGIDISPEMIKSARRLFPEIQFNCANFLELPYEDSHFGSAIAFYAIVNLDYPQVEIAFREIHRVLKNGGQFLCSFHVGTGTRHLDVFLEKEAPIDFYFFETTRIAELLGNTGFAVVDVLERYPYPEVEYPSRRAYVWVEKQ